MCYCVITKKTQRQINKSRHNQIKRLERNNLELQKEPLLSHALAYFLGSALIVRAQPSTASFGIFNPIFDFLYNERYWCAALLILIVLFFCYAIFVGRPKSTIKFASETIVRWAFLPILFFIVNFLNNVVSLLQAHSSDLFVTIFYILGLLILIAVFLRLLVKAISSKRT
jgi:hypothetical protein